MPDPHSFLESVHEILFPPLSREWKAKIRTVAVIGTGVIGSSWIVLFLARALRVIVTDPAPGAATKLADFINTEWPSMERLGLPSGASKINYQFVEHIKPYLKQLDFVQEVIQTRRLSVHVFLLAKFGWHIEWPRNRTIEALHYRQS